MKEINKIKLSIAFLVLLNGLLVFSGTANAQSVCQGKPSGTTCTIDADGHSASYGTCDATGNCNASSTQITNIKGNNGQINDSALLPGITGEESKFIKCGRAGQRMCTLCDLIGGLNLIIHYAMQISIGIGVLAFAAGGVMYIVSAGDPGLKGTANATMKNAALGFVIIFAAWLIVNTVIQSLGAYSNLGIRITSWGQFDCNAKVR